MNWTEAVEKYPIFQGKYRKKIAAKRRIKASQGLDETMTGQDMEQLTNDLIKTMKENLPADTEKPADYNDVITGLKSGKTAELLGFRPEDISQKPINNDNQVPEEQIPYEEQATEEPMTQESQPYSETVLQEDIIVEEPVPQPLPEEPAPPEDIMAGVGNLGQRIADEFKPLTPFIGPINTPIPAPMPTPYPNGRPAVAPKTGGSSSLKIGTSKMWDDDLKFW